MVGNEKASAPSIESLRSACEGSDNAPIGLWNWIAALKSERRSSLLKNFLTKVSGPVREREGVRGLVRLYSSLLRTIYFSFVLADDCRTPQ